MNRVVPAGRAARRGAPLGRRDPRAVAHRAALPQAVVQRRHRAPRGHRPARLHRASSLFVGLRRGARRACARSPRSARPTSRASDEAPGTRLRGDQPHRALHGLRLGAQRAVASRARLLAGPGPVRGGAADDAGGGHARRARRWSPICWLATGRSTTYSRPGSPPAPRSWKSPAACRLGDGASSSATVTASTTSKPTCRTWPSASEGRSRGWGRASVSRIWTPCVQGAWRSLASSLDAERPLAIVTEGLLSYLGRGDVLGLWRRFAETLSGFPNGLYLSDLHVAEDAGGPHVEAFRLALSAFVRGQVQVHFRDAAEAVAALERAGFAEAAVPATSAATACSAGRDSAFQLSARRSRGRETRSASHRATRTDRRRARPGWSAGGRPSRRRSSNKSPCHRHERW